MGFVVDALFWKGGFSHGKIDFSFIRVRLEKSSHLNLLAVMKSFYDFFDIKRSG